MPTAELIEKWSIFGLVMCGKYAQLGFFEMMAKERCSEKIFMAASFLFDLGAVDESEALIKEFKRILK